MAKTKKEIKVEGKTNVAAPIEVAKQVLPEPMKEEKKELKEIKAAKPKVKKDKSEKPAEVKETKPEGKKEALAEKKEIKIQPLEPCEDKRCALHGSLKIRGRIFIGKVISDKRKVTIRVEWPRQCYVPKFERYEKRRSRVHAHNPPCINAKVGDMVKIAECRPLAKTVNFVVIERVK